MESVWNRPLVRTAPAEVAYVAHEVALAVLRHKISHVPSHSPVDGSGFLLAEPVIDGQSAQENQPQAVLQPVHDVIDPLLEMRKREVLCPDLGDVIELLLGNMRESSLEIGEIFLGKTDDPAIGVF